MMLRSLITGLLTVVVTAATAACGASKDAAPESTAATITPPPEGAPIPPTPSPFDVLPDGLQKRLDEPFTGDLDAMIKRRAIRVAVTFNRTHYFIDRGQERGIAYESLKSFEEDLNKKLKTGNVTVLRHTGLPSIAHALIRARIAEGLKQEDLAARLGVKAQQVQRYEATEYQTASLARLHQVADVLGLEWEHIVTRRKKSKITSRFRRAER